MEKSNATFANTAYMPLIWANLLGFGANAFKTFFLQITHAEVVIV